jgi:hypothetical protein
MNSKIKILEFHWCLSLISKYLKSLVASFLSHGLDFWCCGLWILSFSFFFFLSFFSFFFFSEKKEKKKEL